MLHIEEKAMEQIMREYHVNLDNIKSKDEEIESKPTLSRWQERHGYKLSNCKCGRPIVISPKFQGKESLCEKCQHTYRTFECTICGTPTSTKISYKGHTCPECKGKPRLSQQELIEKYSQKTNIRLSEVLTEE